MINEERGFHYLSNLEYFKVLKPQMFGFNQEFDSMPVQC